MPNRVGCVIESSHASPIAVQRVAANHWVSESLRVKAPSPPSWVPPLLFSTAYEVFVVRFRFGLQLALLKSDKEISHEDQDKRKSRHAGRVAARGEQRKQARNQPINPRKEEAMKTRTSVKAGTMRM
jgi:hypothetical protein